MSGGRVIIRPIYRLRHRPLCPNTGRTGPVWQMAHQPPKFDPSTRRNGKKYRKLANAFAISRPRNRLSRCPLNRAFCARRWHPSNSRKQVKRNDRRMRMRPKRSGRAFQICDVVTTRTEITWRQKGAEHQEPFRLAMYPSSRRADRNRAEQQQEIRATDRIATNRSNATEGALQSINVSRPSPQLVVYKTVRLPIESPSMDQIELRRPGRPYLKRLCRDLRHLRLSLRHRRTVITR